MKKIDELKAEIEMAEKELEVKKRDLESKKKELERIEKALNFKVGDYVQYKAFGRRFVGIIRSVLNEKNGYFAIEVQNGIRKPTEIPSETLIEKWQPKKGDLCIFGDFGDEGEAIIGIFLGEVVGDYPFKSIMGVYEYCIPFISEKQYKEHIGYEER